MLNCISFIVTSLVRQSHVRPSKYPALRKMETLSHSVCCVYIGLAVCGAHDFFSVVILSVLSHNCFLFPESWSLSSLELSQQGWTACRRNLSVPVSWTQDYTRSYVRSNSEPYSCKASIMLSWLSHLPSALSWALKVGSGRKREQGRGGKGKEKRGRLRFVFQ